jgi:hypothetical protein
MAAISDYFKHDVSLYPKSGLEFYVFDNSKATAFIQDCLIPFREAYISEDKLTHIVSRFPTTRKEAISRRLPRKGMVMSGDFGEILSFYLAIQTWTPAANVLPMKWRFRDSKKDASKYTDIILFSLQDPDNPSTSDSMFTYEVKTCATGLGNSVYKIHKRPSYVNYKDGKLECTILEAVFDANKDAVERAAETIPYLLTRCEDEDLYDLHKQIYRFREAAKTTYQKEYNAVAVVDSTTLAEQINRMPSDLLTMHPNVKNVYCVPMDNLQSVYESIYSDIRKQAK